MNEYFNISFVIKLNNMNVFILEVYKTFTTKLYSFKKVSLNYFYKEISSKIHF